MALFEKKRSREEGTQQAYVNGLPGALGSREETPLPPEVQYQLLTQPASEQRIRSEDVLKAADILKKYKSGKASLENRIVQDELWWEERHWEVIRKEKDPAAPLPASAWLVNTVLAKHADAMDNYPEPMILPRERSDEASARTLSSILPVVLENNDFEQTYSDNNWELLKHGTAAYGVFWNSEKENGLGDIDIREIDLLKIFWEPGIRDIQDSRNLFIVDLVDEDVLDQQYPEHKGRLHGGVVDVKKYCYDENIDTSQKSVVVDWYYKKRTLSGRTAVHYVKFVGDIVLYASENDPEYRDRGFYDHGLYPVVFDVLYPVKGTPAGFGFVSLCKDPQLYVDQLSANILENSMMGTKKRFFVSANTNINKQQFLDWSDPLIEVEGELDDRRIKELEVRPLDPIYMNVMQMKIDEMRTTSMNNDVNSGSTGSGVTSGAAISALQEAGNKGSRDMIAASYRAHCRIVQLCIELMRQFYDESRAFRVTGQLPGSYEFVDFSNAGIKDQVTGMDSQGGPLFRKPIFDVKVKAQRKNPFSRMEQNQRAMELFAAGFFNPEAAQQAQGALEMMDFEGIDKVKEYVSKGQTLLNVVQQMSQQMDQMAMIIQASTGVDMGIGQQAQMPGKGPAPTGKALSGGEGAGSRMVDQAVSNQTSLQQKMAEGARA